MVSDSSHACSFAPQYNDDELGGYSVSLEDFATNASEIFLGTVKTIVGPGKIEFQIHASAESLQNSSKAVAFFKDVESSIYLQGRDEQSFYSEQELIDYIDFIGSLEGESIPKKGSGGVLAGIFHGSDCERKTLSYEQQEYLVFLDDKKFVMAMFPIVGSKFPDLNHTIKNISRTIRNPSKKFEPQSK